MTKRSELTALTTIALLGLGAFWIATGIPLRWAKGIVRGPCSREPDSFTCEVELVPDGSRVKASSDDLVPDGSAVELRLSVNAPDRYTYKIIAH